MWSYKVKNIEDKGTQIAFLYEVLNDGNIVTADTLIVDCGAFQSIPSDGRIEYVQNRIAETCKRYMLVKEVKTDFSSLVGVDVPLEAMRFETKAEISARAEAKVIEDIKTVAVEEVL